MATHTFLQNSPASKSNHGGQERTKITLSAFKKALDDINSRNIALIDKLLELSKTSGVDAFATWKSCSYTDGKTISLFPSDGARTVENIAHFMEGYLFSYKRIPNLKPGATDLLETKLLLTHVLMDLEETAKSGNVLQPVAKTAKRCNKRGRESNTTIVVHTAGMHIL